VLHPTSIRADKANTKEINLIPFISAPHNQNILFLSFYHNNNSPVKVFEGFYE
jgi:hypothetical protein